MSAPLLLALDQGTQSARAMLFDGNGELIAKYQQHIEPYLPDRPGEAEQDVNYFWEQLGQVGTKWASSIFWCRIACNRIESS